MNTNNGPFRPDPRWEREQVEFGQAQQTLLVSVLATVARAVLVFGCEIVVVIWRGLRTVWLKRKYDVLIGIVMLGIVCALETPSFAFLPGVPTVVFDPAVAATTGTIAGTSGAILGVNAAILGTGLSTLATIIMEYEIALAEYQRIDGATRGGWQTVPQLPNIDATMNRVGELAGWSGAMNGTVGVMSGVWQEATIGIQPSTEIWSEEIPGQSKVLAPLASVEAIDGSASRCLDQVAQARANWGLNQAVIMNLMGAAADGSDAFNGTVGQINITNGTIQQGNEERRTQTAIQSCLVEQMALSNKMQRDNLAAQLNQQATTLFELETMPTNWDGSTTFLTPIP